MRIRESEKILNDVHKAYHELSKAVGGFNATQKDIILPLCVEATLINHGVSENQIDYMKLFKGE